MNKKWLNTFLVFLVSCLALTSGAATSKTKKTKAIQEKKSSFSFEGSVDHSLPAKRGSDQVTDFVLIGSYSFTSKITGRVFTPFQKVYVKDPGTSEVNAKDIGVYLYNSFENKPLGHSWSARLGASLPTSERSQNDDLISNFSVGAFQYFFESWINKLST